MSCTESRCCEASKSLRNCLAYSSMVYPWVYKHSASSWSPQIVLLLFDLCALCVVQGGVIKRVACRLSSRTARLCPRTARLGPRIPLLL
eukprot:6195718-Pleurochrysis_carterae.AAC.1